MRRPPRSRIRLARALVAAAACAVVGAPAPAGVQLVGKTGTGFAWDLGTEQPNVVNGSVTYFVDVSGLHDVTHGPKSAAEAVRAAVGAWEVPTSRIRFAPDTRPSAADGLNGADRVNWIGWSRGDLGRATFAATFPTRKGEKILDMDIVLNDRDFVWDTWADGVPGDSDIQGLVAHEWGHAIGADHVPLRGSTMYFESTDGVVSLRSLAEDDVALVGSIYPNDLFLSETGAVAGRIDVAGTANDRAAHVVAVSVGSGVPAASALSRADGTFEIRGLPRGTYRVVVAPCVPLGNAMNTYWRSGSTSFLPASAGDGAAPLVHADTLLVEGGTSIDVGEIRVRTSQSPLEPNDTPAQATRIDVGDAVSGRFEAPGDEDWFVFRADQGQNVTIKVLAWELGSAADPTLRLTDDTGGVLRTVFDIRDDRFGHLLEGEDRDARIPAPGNSIDAGDPPWIVPATGDYRVRVAQDVPSQSSQSFYVLLVSFASASPSPSLTKVSAVPDRADAGSGSSTTIVVRAKTEGGDAIGSANVGVTRDGDPEGSALFAAGDASFRLDVAAPASPGTEEFRGTVATPNGLATTSDAAVVVWLGPMDPATSLLAAQPRRIAADGASAALVRFVPRDLRDELLGPGRTIGATLVPPRGAQVGAATSADDGTYTIPVTAGTETGASTLSVKVDAQGSVAQTQIAFGFGLADVLTAVAADVAAFRATPKLPLASRTALATAAKRVSAALAAANDLAHRPQSELRALTKMRSALLDITTAIQRSGKRLKDPGAARDLALATREAADGAVDRAEANVKNARDQRRVDTARALLAKGEKALGAKKAPSAQALFLAAYRAVPLSQ